MIASQEQDLESPHDSRISSDNDTDWCEALETQLSDEWDRLEASLHGSADTSADAHADDWSDTFEDQLSDAWERLETSLHHSPVALLPPAKLLSRPRPTTSACVQQAYPDLPVISVRPRPVIKAHRSILASRSLHYPSVSAEHTANQADCAVAPAKHSCICTDARKKPRVEESTFCGIDSRQTDSVGSIDEPPHISSSQLALRPKPTTTSSPERARPLGTPHVPFIGPPERQPPTPLDFQIPQHLLQAARRASPGSHEACWTHKLYRSSQDKPVTVYLCTKKVHVAKVLERFANASVLGFDLEWEMYAKIASAPPKRLVSVAQLAMEDAIAVIQLATFYEDKAEDLFPPELRALLESPRVIKTGVNISNDFRRLNKVFGVQGRGICELSRLYRVVQYANSAPEKVNHSLVRLASQVEHILDLPLYKGSVRCSAWSQRLSKAQTDYAAADAYAGFRLYHELETRRYALSPVPPPPQPFDCLSKLDTP